MDRNDRLSLPALAPISNGHLVESAVRRSNGICVDRAAKEEWFDDALGRIANSSCGALSMKVASKLYAESGIFSWRWVPQH